MAKFTDILKQEYKTKGAVTGLVSATGKKALEVVDLRNALFGGYGITSIVGRKTFGKGYSALNQPKITPAETVERVSSNDVLLKDIRNNSIISAKNSMVLPVIAGQINLVQKNIAKLVKLQGETPSKKAGSFFSESKFRENAYEASLLKLRGTKQTTPTQIKDKDSSKGLFGGLLSGLSGMFGSFFGSSLGTIFGRLTGSLLPLIATVGLVGFALDKLAVVIKNIINWFADSWIGKKLGIKPMSKGEGFGPFGREQTEPGEEGPEGRNSIGSTVADAAAIGGITAGGIIATKGVIKGVSALKASKEAILDVRTMSGSQIAKSTPKSIWGRFLLFLTKKGVSQAIVLRLAQSATLATIPFVGWIGALINLGLGLSMAYKVYELWREFNNSEEEKTVQKQEEPNLAPSSTAEAEGMIPPSPSPQPNEKTPTQQPKKSEAEKPSKIPTPSPNTKEPDDVLVEQILSTIKTRESGGNYTAQSPNSSASGAYQYIDKTWQSVTKKYGIGVEYRRAKDAPPEIQDEVARRNVKDILKQVDGDVSKVPNIWYTGNAEGKMTPQQLAANNGLTSEQYQQKWLTSFNQSGKTQVALAPSTPSKGSTLSQGSIQVADANRSLSKESNPILLSDNRVTNNQSGGQMAHGGTSTLSYDKELVGYLIGRTT